MVFSNADEELEKLKLLKEEIDSINEIELEKLFVSVEDISRIFQCSERRAREFINSIDCIVKLGSKPYVNINVLNEFTKQRIVMLENT